MATCVLPTPGAPFKTTGALLDERALSEIQHPLFVELGHGGEVEVGQFLDHRKGGLLDPPGDGLGLSVLDLQLGQLLEEEFIRRILLAALPSDGGPLAQHGGQTQGLEVAGQQEMLAHAATSSRDSSWS